MTINHIPSITYPVILMAVFANQICLPVPAVLFLITAGALVESGRLNFGSVILAGVVGSLLADYAWFLAGSLRRKGISNVWVLEGGLQAWRELDLPVTTELSSPVELAARFGVELPE